MSVYCVCALSIARTCVATWNCCARACVRMCTTVPSMSNNRLCDVTYTASARVERFLELRSLFIAFVFLIQEHAFSSLEVSFRKLEVV